MCVALCCALLWVVVSCYKPILLTSFMILLHWHWGHRASEATLRDIGKQIISSWQEIHKITTNNPHQNRVHMLWDILYGSLLCLDCAIYTLVYSSSYLFIQCSFIFQACLCLSWNLARVSVDQIYSFECLWKFLFTLEHHGLTWRNTRLCVPQRCQLMNHRETKLIAVLCLQDGFSWAPLFFKKTLSYWFRDSHYKSETVVRRP